MKSQIVGLDADACIFGCCEYGCTRLLILVWSIAAARIHQFEELKDKGRAAGWLIFRTGDPSGDVRCPNHNPGPAVRS